MNSIQQLPRAVLFDYDGVLVASEPIHLLAWMQLLDELGLPRDVRQIQNNIGKTSPEIMRQLILQYQPEKNPTDDELQDLARRKNSFYISQAEKNLRTYPGAIEGLKWLRLHQIQTAVVSNAKRNELLKTMNLLGLTPLFDQVISRDDTSAFKPDPTPYLMAAAGFGLEAQDCIAIEDSPPGLEAGLMARVPTVAVTTNLPKEHLESPVPGRPDLKPIKIVSSLQEFFDWIKTLTN